MQNISVILTFSHVHIMHQEFRIYYKIKGLDWAFLIKGTSLAWLSKISNCTKMSKYLLYRFFKTLDSVMLSNQDIPSVTFSILLP